MKTWRRSRGLVLMGMEDWEFEELFSHKMHKKHRLELMEESVRERVF